jgi:choline dehydrogenase-like flavoprotein
MGEVVDDRLRVKVGPSASAQFVKTDLVIQGARNLRVIDASVFPGHVSGNIMATT